MEIDNTVKEETVKKVVSKIYRDAMVFQTADYFIKLKYRANQFKDLVDAKTFKTIVGFLPNSKFRGSPFVMSVSYYKKTDEYEITVHNPRVKF